MAGYKFDAVSQMLGYFHIYKIRKNKNVLKNMRSALGNKNVLKNMRSALGYTVKLLLSDQLRDHQKAVAEEKGSPNATKVHHTKQRDGIYYTSTTQYFEQNSLLLVPI